MKVFSFTGLLVFPFIPLELDQRDTEPKVASWANFENPTSSHEWMFLVGWFSKRMDEEGSNKSGGRVEEGDTKAMLDDTKAAGFRFS